MAATPIYALRYPTLADAPHGPQGFQNLAEDVEAQLARNAIPVVTDPATISSPFTGQLCFRTTDNLVYRYDGAAWVDCIATGGNSDATRHEARYTQTTQQPVADTTDTKMTF